MRQLSNPLQLTGGSITDLVDLPGGKAYHLNGLHASDGGNYLALERNSALFGTSELGLSMAFKADAAGQGGTLFRIHTALHIDVTDDGQLVFNLLENSVGESGVIKSIDLNVADGAWHHMALTYDARAGVMTGYVDGTEVGSIAVTGPTQIAESWDPVIGDPWGNGFRGLVDTVEIAGRAQSSEEVSRQYEEFVQQIEGGKTLFRLDFENGTVADRSGNAVEIIHGSAESIVDGSYYLNGAHSRDGGNHIGLGKDELFYAKETMDISLSFKSAEPGVGGSLFRIHTALHIDITDKGAVLFKLRENSVGESGMIDTGPLGVTDGEWHNLQLVYDAGAGTMVGYVDGLARGEIPVSGPTKPVEYWGPMIGEPWGHGFRGHVDDIRIHASEVNTAPIAGTDDATVAEDTVLTIPAADLLANDSDADGDSLSILDARVVSGSGTAYVAQSGDIVFRPDADQNGEVTVAYMLDDGNEGHSVGTVLVDVTSENDAPVATGGQFSVLNSAAADTAVGRVLAHDVDGDALEFTITDGNQDGVFAIDPEGQITIADSYSLSQSGNGTKALSITVADSAGISTNVDVLVSISSIAELLTMAEQKYANPILVHDSAAFIEALENAVGGETILLRPDVDYGGIVKTGNAMSDVRVTSLDPGAPATITGLDLRSVSNLTFDNLHFEFHGTPNQYQTDIRVSDSDNVRFTNSVFRGLADGYAATGDDTAQNMLHVRNSSDFSFENNDVSQFMHGLAVMNSSGISIRSNDVHHLQGDGMRFAQVQDITIEDNRLHDFFGADQGVTHNDYIQFWTTNTTAPSTDITIRGNAFLSGDFQSQAIFFRDQLGDAGLGEMRFQNVVVEENVIYNNHTHGITIPNADGLVIRGNSLITHPESGELLSSINVANATGVEVYDNVTPKLSVDANNEIVRLDGNVLIQDTHAIQAGYIDAQFVNPRQGAGAELSDLYVLPDGELVKDDGTVFGSEKLAIPSTPDELTAVVVGAADGLDDSRAFTFDARYTADEDGLITEDDARFTWDFGDGETGEGRQVSHVYDLGGEYQVMLTVLHDNGATDTARVVAAVDQPQHHFLDFDDGKLAFHSSSLNDIWTS